MPPGEPDRDRACVNVVVLGSTGSVGRGALDVIAHAGNRRGATVIPVDSEHSAIDQCLRSGSLKEVRRVVLTSSGGPFRGKSRRDLAEVTPEQALRHPTWRMGPKITIDSATLMNKALEVI